MSEPPANTPVNTIERAYIVRGGLPRKVLPDLCWLGGCSNSSAWPGPAAKRRPITHEPCSAFLILGSEKTLLLDTGHFAHWYSFEGQLETMLQGRGVDYIFPSHQEIPHSGNLGRLMQKFPNAITVGDVRDYHLFHPEIGQERLRPMAHGERLNLGDREWIFLDAFWKDLSGSMWGYDTKLKLLFASDGFGYIHLHEANICGTMLHEMSATQIAQATDRPALPFTGMHKRDQSARVAAFRNLMAQYPIEIIISGHTGPMMGPPLAPAIEKMLTSIATNKTGPQYLQSSPT
jgi:flavorubredoxin